MTTDDEQWLRALHDAFGGERFTLRQIHRTVCRATRPAMRAHEAAEYIAIVRNLAGYVESCPGPRGGEGYCLTGGAMVHLAQTKQGAS